MRMPRCSLLLLLSLVTILVMDTRIHAEEFAFRDKPVIVVARIQNNLPGGLATFHYGNEEVRKPIQSTEAITDAFISRLNETHRFRVIERDLLPELQVEMFNSEEDLVATMTKYPGIFKADYVFICKLSVLTLELRLTQIGTGVKIEKAMVTAHFDMRIVDLNPHKYWQVVETVEKRTADGRFETEEEAIAELKDLQEENPQLKFEIISPPENRPGEHVWGAHGEISKANAMLTQLGNFLDIEVNLLNEGLIINTMMLGLEDLIVRIMEDRWPLKVEHVDDQQRIYLDRGGWLIKRAGERAGIPGIKIGKVGDRVYQFPNSFFVIRELGQVIRDPDTGIPLSGPNGIRRERGKELAKIRVDRSEADLEGGTQSIGELIEGSATNALINAICEPLTMDALKKEGREATNKKIVLRKYLQEKYQLRLPVGYFADLPAKWNNPDATYFGGRRK